MSNVFMTAILSQRKCWSLSANPGFGIVIMARLLCDSKVTVKMTVNHLFLSMLASISELMSHFDSKRLGYGSLAVIGQFGTDLQC